MSTLAVRSMLERNFDARKYVIGLLVIPPDRQSLMAHIAVPALARRRARTQSVRTRRLFYWPSLGPLLIACVLGVVMLGMVYRLPLQRIEDVGAWAGFGQGLHAVETIGAVSYVHTDGDARVRLPETGGGSFVVRLQLGGPGGVATNQAHLAVDDNTLDLGTVADLRTYHILAPANQHGDIGLRIRGPTLQLADDPRELGVMIDWLGLRSLVTGSFPLPLLGATLFCLTCFSFAFAGLGIGPRRQLVLLSLLAIMLNLAPLASRGQVALGPWWLGLSLSALIATALTLSEGSVFLLSLPGIATIFMLWRLLLWLIGGVGLWWSQIVYRHGRGIAYNLERTDFGHEQIVWRTLAGGWMQWDSLHYQAIATTGYTFTGLTWPNIAFFPLYPLLIRAITPLTAGSTTLAALVISNLALLAALLVLYDLVARDFDRVTAYRSVLLLLLFPTSFYLAAGYTESLALALGIAAVWAMRRQRWWLAGAAGFLLALTRVPGVLIAPVLACAYLQHQRWTWRALLRPQILAVVLPPLGLASFMLYQWLAFGTPFAFLSAQGNWNNGMALPWIIPQKILRALRVSPEWEMATIQLAVWVGFIGLAVAALWRLPLVYGLTTVLLLLPPFLANQRGSLIRHVLIGFPIFIVLALITERRWLRWLLYCLMLPLLVIFTLLFVNGFGLA